MFSVSKKLLDLVKRHPEYLGNERQLLIGKSVDGVLIAVEQDIQFPAQTDRLLAIAMDYSPNIYRVDSHTTLINLVSSFELVDRDLIKLAIECGKRLNKVRNTSVGIYSKKMELCSPEDVGYFKDVNPDFAYFGRDHIDWAVVIGSASLQLKVGIVANEGFVTLLNGTRKVKYLKRVVLDNGSEERLFLVK